jgi:hypothetical protein
VESCGCGGTCARRGANGGYISKLSIRRVFPSHAAAKITAESPGLRNAQIEPPAHGYVIGPPTSLCQ